MLSKHVRTLTLQSVLVFACISAGCSVPTVESVSPRFELINKTASALSAASITVVNGTYSATCAGRLGDGTSAWVVDRVTPGNTSLTVIKNDNDCLLTITNVVTAAGTFLPGAPIPLDAVDTYQSSASPFALSGDPLAFYGNAKISSLSYASDFLVSLLVSDEPSATDSGDHAATAYATRTATVAASTVPAPSYTVGLGSFVVLRDDNNVVDSVSGYAQLTAGSQAGQDYAVHLGALDGTSTYGDVGSAFDAAATSGLISGLTALRVPASGFGLATIDLDTSPQRTLIIRNMVSEVASYQLFLVTFTP
jgi:hypothetical protein